MDRPSTRLAIHAALAGNLLVAITKATAAWWTGSSSMASEAVHSLVDSGNELLLLYGMHRSKMQPDREHPIGYGRELYFWSFIVAVLVFGLGAGISFLQGAVQLRAPRAIEDPLVNYVVLALSFLFEAASWLVSLRQFNASRGHDSFAEAVVRSKNPPAFIVLLEDSAALIGILIAAGGIASSHALDEPRLDGVASMLIGLVLAATAAIVARESKSLLIGERADRRMSDSILRIAAAHEGVESANGVLTVQLAPDQVVAALSVRFTASMSARDVERVVEALEAEVRSAHPQVVELFVKPQAPQTWRRRGGE